MATSSGCLTRDRVIRTRVFSLDACGGIKVAGVSSVIDYNGWETIAFSDQVTAGSRETITAIDGTTCRDKEACPTDHGQQLVLSECAENWSMMAAAGYGILVYDGTDPTLIVGFDRTAVDCTATVALELLFALPAACGAGTVQVLARLYPMLERFVIGGNKQVDGAKAIRGTYTANTILNANLFKNFTTPGTPVGEMAHWAPNKASVNAGTQFYIDRVVNTPTDFGVVGCDFRAFKTT